MAIPKSANERIRRKVRSKKIGPKGHDTTGRIAVKKTANNDPRRNNAQNKCASEEFLKWYRGDNINNPAKFKKLIENLIEIGIEAGGKVSFPFNILRLSELKESIKDSTPYVIINKRIVTVEQHVCPVCNEEIGEKSTFLPEDQRDADINDLEWEHQCGGRFKYPPVNNIGS